MSIAVKEISKYYGEQKALDKVSFTVNKGEIVGFLGPNGAGKSTLMKILTGYISPSEGLASVNNYLVATHPAEVQRSVGYLPEHNPLYTEMYVREYLGFTASVYSTPKEE
jgi:ABC-2 type transport system ATP-binding protein